MELRILLTNNTLASRAGSELYVRDVALELVRRGHEPVCYSSALGEVAEELRRGTVPVIDDLTSLNVAPDVIHGQHHLDAMTAMLRFPRVPAIYVCHGWVPWEEQPPLFPSIGRYLAVDDLCRERLLTTRGICSQSIEVLLNFVDLDRFVVRSALPERPRAALVFGNNAKADGYLLPIRAACRKFGIERIDVAGAGSGQPSTMPEQLLGQYDLVFAKARCALEALAAGTAVIVADAAGLGGLVSTENMERLRRLNFGVRTMQAEPISEEAVLAALGNYRCDDARRVTEWIRNVAGMKGAIDRLVSIYGEVLAAPPALPTERSVSVAASDYLRSLASPIKSRHESDSRVFEATLAFEQMQHQWKYARAVVEQREKALQLTENHAINLQHALDQARLALANRESELADLQHALKETHGSRAWKAIGYYRRLIAQWRR